MTKKKSVTPYKNIKMGRKRQPIKWDVVDKFLMAGSNGVQIASVCGISDDTLYRRTMEEKGVPFATYSTIQRQKGNSMILGKQYQKAMEGNVSMLIWLGKQRLGQTDQPKEKEEFNGSLAGILDVMHMIKSSGDFSALVQKAKNDSRFTELKSIDEPKDK